MPSAILPLKCILLILRGLYKPYQNRRHSCRKTLQFLAQGGFFSDPPRQQGLGPLPSIDHAMSLNDSKGYYGLP
jgi:hypothetical protein